MTIQNASELQSVLLETLGNTERLILDLSKVTEIDLSCLQLLCSAHMATMESKKCFAIINNYPEIFVKAVEDAGFQQQTGCRTDSDNECFCIKGGS